ncbi:MAG: tetratricopeptide repeat protein, partial [Chloroflexi bacterium]|nr:tetratricopeptide repeat protein [Chloroflexota bacterium]
MRAESQGRAAEIKEAQGSLRLAEQTLISDIEQQRNKLREAAGYYLEERVPQGPVSATPSLPPGVQQDLQKLIAIAEQRLLPQPETAEEHFYRGNAHFESGNYEEALTAYDKSLELRPDKPVTHLNRGAASSKLDRSEDAL